MVALVGCVDSGNQSQATLGRSITGPEALKPEAQPYDRGALILAGTRIAVDMNARADGEWVTFELRAHDEVLEEERYRSSSAGFFLVGAAGERCEPPIPLLRYPMTVGDTWTWTGRLVSGGIEREGKGAITTGNDRLNLPGDYFEAVRVRVELEFAGGGPEPARRELVFWFREGRGIYRREFGAGSTREPIGRGSD